MRITNIRNMSSHWRLLAEPILTAPLHIVGILSDRATPFGSSSFFNNFASSPGPYSTHPPHGIGAPAVVASQSLGSATAWRRGTAIVGECRENHASARNHAARSKCWPMLRAAVLRRSC